MTTKTSPINIYRTHWTPEKMKAMRAKFGLSQVNLAIIANAPQQRISEWELGRHSMKRPYTAIFDQITEKLERLKTQSGKDAKKFKRLVLESFGVELE